jgi:hypothetical protein
MQERADDLEGDAKQKLDTEIELLQVERENLSDAISAVESADLENWESKKSGVEKALERVKK